MVFLLSYASYFFKNKLTLIISYLPSMFIQRTRKIIKKISEKGVIGIQQRQRSIHIKLTLIF